MPFRHGNTYRALGWLAGTVLIGLVWPSLAQEGKRGEQPPGQSQADTKQTPAEPPAAPAVSADRPLPEPDPKNYRDPCRDPQTDDESDLCQQWRMAEAAEETTDWTFGQILVTGVEAVLLAIAIGIASWAGYWARRAAVATAETVMVTRDNAKIELRAYIGISRIDTITATDIWDPSKTRKVLGYTIRPQISNSGVTPAVDFKCFADHQIVRTDNFITPIFQKPLVDEEIMTTVGAKEMITGPVRVVSYDDVQRVLERKTRWFVWWRFEYRDVFDDTPPHHTEACYEIIVPGNPKIINPGDTLPEFSARIFGAQNNRS